MDTLENAFALLDHADFDSNDDAVFVVNKGVKKENEKVKAGRSVQQRGGGRGIRGRDGRGGARGSSNRGTNDGRPEVASQNKEGFVEVNNVNGGRGRGRGRGGLRGGRGICFGKFEVVSQNREASVEGNEENDGWMQVVRKERFYQRPRGGLYRQYANGNGYRSFSAGGQNHVQGAFAELMNGNVLNEKESGSSENKSEDSYVGSRGYGNGNGGFRGGMSHPHSKGNGRGNGVQPRRDDARVASQKENVNAEKDQTENDIVNGNNENGGVQSEAAEVPKETGEDVVEHVKCSFENVSVQSSLKEEVQEMTLEEYEKVLVEKRKPLQVSKTYERKVDVSEFVGMQAIEKKLEDDLHIKLTEERPKKKSTVHKEEKSHKIVSIDEFLANGNRYNGRGHGHGRGRGQEDRGGYNHNRTKFQRRGNGNGIKDVNILLEGPNGNGSNGRGCEHGDRGGCNGTESQRRGNDNGNKDVKMLLEDSSQFPVLG